MSDKTIETNNNNIELNNQYKASLNEFKIWDKKNKRWGKKESFALSPEGDIYGISYGVHQNRIARINNDDYIICRYIGLSYEEKDAMNLRAYKIYEGDILQGIDELHNIKIFGYVDFQDGSFVIKNEIITHYRWMDYDVKRIGNLYEDTTLMQKLEDEDCYIEIEIDKELGVI